MNELKNRPTTEYKHGECHPNQWPGDMQKYD